MKYSSIVFALLGLSLLSCDVAYDEAERNIRKVREISNAAIAAHDTTAMAQTLTADYNLVTSRNAVSSTRSVMMGRLGADMAAKPDLVYHRATVAVRIFKEWGMASESGTWTGSWTEPNGDRIKLSGTYYAKWHRIDGQWKIRAEIFTPLSCTGGAYCDKGPLEN